MSAPHDPGQDTNRAFVNTYRNARTESQQTERPEIKCFLDATDGVLAQAAEFARVVASAHQGAVTQMIGGDWSQTCKYFSLSEKYAAWADYHTPPWESASMPTLHRSTSRCVCHRPSSKLTQPGRTLG